MHAMYFGTTFGGTKLSAQLAGDTGVGKTALHKNLTSVGGWDKAQSVRDNHRAMPILSCRQEDEAYFPSGELLCNVIDASPNRLPEDIVKTSNADFYVVCFSVAEPETRESVSNWLRAIQRHETSEAPIFIVGTKSDLVDSQAKQEAADFVADVAKEESRVLGYYECSATQPQAELKNLFIEMCRKSQQYDKKQAEFANETDWPRFNHLCDPKCR